VLRYMWYSLIFAKRTIW